MSRLDLSVVVTARNRAESLPVLLGRLEQQTMPPARFEIVVVDCGSTDGTADHALRYARGAPVRIRVAAQSDPGEIAAKNLGATMAEGRNLLFLDADLLPGRALLEGHMHARQGVGGHACVLGGIRPHPRLIPGTFTRWHLPEDRPPPAGVPALPRHKMLQNMSVPRAAFHEAGGLDASLEAVRTACLDLALRLDRLETPVVENHEAAAFIWCATCLDCERARVHHEGRDLHTLILRHHAPELKRQFFLVRASFLNLADRIFIPFYLRACQESRPDVRSLGPTYRRILRYERFLGYSDARRNRPPAGPPPCGRAAEPALRGPMEQSL